MRIKQIITHPGAAHRDDLLATAILLANCSGYPPIIRKEPTASELTDPEIAVIDVGRSHDPDKLNFDHHQFPRDGIPTCALNLITQHLGLEESFKLANSWYDLTAVVDCKGPNYAKDWLGLPSLGSFFQMCSPVEKWLLHLFQAAKVIFPEHQRKAISTYLVKKNTFPQTTAHFLYEALMNMGTHMTDLAQEYKERWDVLPEIESVDIPNSGFKFFDARRFEKSDNPTLGLNNYISSYRPECVVSITQDERNKGYQIYRMNDHSAIDLTLLDNDDRILFTHPGGFVAKTKDQNLTDEDVGELISMGVKRL